MTGIPNEEALENDAVLFGTAWASKKVTRDTGAGTHIVIEGESEKLRPFLWKQRTAGAGLCCTKKYDTLPAAGARLWRIVSMHERIEE